MGFDVQLFLYMLYVINGVTHLAAGLGGGVGSGSTTRLICFIVIPYRKRDKDNVTTQYTDITQGTALQCRHIREKQ